MSPADPEAQPPTAPHAASAHASDRLRGLALAHDYLLVMRGAERTFAAMAACWPAAPVYTLLYDAAATGDAFRARQVRCSYLQRLPVRQRGFRALLPLFPGAVDRLRVEQHPVLVSSSSAFAHGLRVPSGSTHICYCHSPFRYAWHERHRALEEVRRPLRPVVRRTLDRIREWDLDASTRVSHYIANSRITRERIAEFWGRDSRVVHPPVDVDRFHPSEPEDYVLIVTELVPHKRVEVALRAAQRAGLPVRVVGTGPDLPRLRHLSGPHAEFLGRVDDLPLARLYARARALVVPNVEEFGITAVEAQAAGRPVVAVAAGGATETVVDGRTGVLVPPGDGDALAEALRHTDFDSFSTEDLQANAQRFSAAAFKRRLREEVTRLAAASA